MLQAGQFMFRAGCFSSYPNRVKVKAKPGLAGKWPGSVITSPALVAAQGKFRSEAGRFSKKANPVKFNSGWGGFLSGGGGYEGG